MLKSLRGRNLAHIGCMLGVVTGLGGGIILAWVLILHNVASAVALLLWVALVVILGAIGYNVGVASSSLRPPPPDA
jgi:NhaP-type Na+/H+ or K+/H+ antiporter